MEKVTSLIFNISLLEHTTIILYERNGSSEQKILKYVQEFSDINLFHGRISAHDYESLLRGRAKSHRPLPVSLRIARSEDAPTQCDCCVFLNVQQSHHVN